MTLRKKLLGAHGENLAQEHLRKQGYKILARNFRTRWGELDLVAEKGGVIYFFEVKTRTSLKMGLPAEAVTRKKAEHLQKASWIFLSSYHLEDKDYRFRILSIRLRSSTRFSRFRDSS